MESLRKELSKVLQGRIVVLGVGNRLRGDDGAGPRVVEGIQGQVDAFCVDAGPAPENYLETIIKENPNTVLIVDAMDFGAPPATVRVLDAGRMAGQQGLSTHALSLQMACHYLKTRMPVDIFVLGIQPDCVVLGETMSEKVSKAVGMVAEVLIGVCGRA